MMTVVNDPEAAIAPQYGPKIRWGAVMAAFIFTGLLWRITINVDLSDESYYAIFVHDWLLVGLRASTLTTLHQTAALIVYPFVLSYTKLIGSMFGLFLALRSFYVMSSIASALVVLNFISRLRGPTCGWLAASAVIAFVPFGLPAPSYDTLGLQGLTMALAAFGCAALTDQRAAYSSAVWRVVSGGGWAVAIVAYPTLGLPFGAFCWLVLLFGQPILRSHRSYVVTIILMVSSTLMIAVWALSPTKIVNSVAFLNDVNGVSDFGSKISKSLTEIQAVPGFPYLLIGMTLVGALRCAIPATVICMLSASAIVALQFEPAAFFVRSHDALTLAALSGLGLLAGLRPKATAENRTIALLVATSLFAGVITAATAFNGAFNFCIGCAPAAILTMAAPSTASGLSRLLRNCAQFSLVSVLAFSSMTDLYGDGPVEDGARVRISQGVFAGLLVKRSQANLIDFASSLADLGPQERTIAEFGRLPGLILATRRQALQLMTLPPQPIGGPALETIRSFYNNELDRPSLIMLASDQYGAAFNPIGASFPMWYRRCGMFAQDMTSIDVFCRRL